MAYYHYTTAVRLEGILIEGVIKRSREFVKQSGGRPAVWFSTRRTWEPTATKGILTPAGRRRATLPEMVEHHGRLVRLAVPEDVARHTWATHRQRHERADVADGLEGDARRHGADPADWRVSYHDVPLDAVHTVEVSEDGETWTLIDHLVIDELRAAATADD